MSQWDPNPASTTAHQPVSPESSLGGRPEGVSSPGRPPLPMPWWIRCVPFFVSAFFFLSALFAVFSPLPLMLVYFRSGRRWAALALATNCALVAAAGGTMSAAIYFIFMGVLAFSLCELMVHGKSVEKSGAYSLLTVAACGALLLLA